MTFSELEHQLAAAKAEKEENDESRRNLISRLNCCQEELRQGNILYAKLTDTKNDLESVLSSAKAEIDQYRDCLADMHTGLCRFDDPPATDETLECMACWAFETVRTKLINNKRLREALEKIGYWSEFKNIKNNNPFAMLERCQAFACAALDGGKA